MMIYPLRMSHIPYESSLRVVGRYLDGDSPLDFAVAENGGGLAVTFTRSGSHGELISAYFDWDKLSDLAVFHTAGRGTRSRHRVPAPILPDTSSFEDIFRALGHDLDARSCGQVRIQGSRLELSIEYRQGDVGASLCQRSISPREIKSLVASARARRQRLRVVE